MVLKNKALNRLSKFLLYVLGRHPDEFGLIPNSQGFVKLKELLKAIREEDGYRHIRQSNLEEIIVTLPDPSIEMSGAMIRANNRERLPALTETTTLPKHLYTCIRRRAHPHVLTKGITPMGSPHVVMSDSEEMAKRMGRRIDWDPVTLTVQTVKSLKQRVQFYQLGERLYLADAIPAGCFMAPPLPKQPVPAANTASDREKQRDPHPGTYPLTPQITADRGSRKGKKDGVSWKRDARKIRRKRDKW